MPLCSSSHSLRSPEESWWRQTVRQRLQPFLSISPRDDINAIQSSRLALAHEIAAAEAALRLAKTYQNSLADIHRLPVEIIARCFRWLVVIDPPRRNVDEDEGSEFSEDEVHNQSTIGWMKVMPWSSPCSSASLR